MFYLLPEDILVKIISYSSSNNLKKIIILNKNFNNFLRKSYADIIFYNIVIAGLDGDYKRNNFGEIHKLIPLCDNITKKKSLCLKCNNGNKALFSHRICSNDSQILVGSENKYIPVCRKHYLELN